VKTRRTQRALYHSSVPLELNLYLKIHLPVMMLESTGRGTRSQILLAIKVAYSSSMTRCQDGSARAAWTEVGIRESGDDEVVDKVSLSAGSRKPRFARVVNK
jgi:hypothetical protein